MERYEEIERSIITVYRKKIWSNFIKGIKEFEMVQQSYDLIKKKKKRK